jgi:hypothetical protein
MPLFIGRLFSDQGVPDLERKPSQEKKEQKKHHNMVTNKLRLFKNGILHIL